LCKLLVVQAIWLCPHPLHPRQPSEPQRPTSQVGRRKNRAGWKRDSIQFTKFTMRFAYHKYHIFNSKRPFYHTTHQRMAIYMTDLIKSAGSFGVAANTGNYQFAIICNKAMLLEHPVAKSALKYSMASCRHPPKQKSHLRVMRNGQSI